LLDGPADLIVQAAEQAHFVWLAPPCSPYSVAAVDRPQLFSVESKWWAQGVPEGAEARSNCWSEYVRRAMLISRFVARVILACHTRRIPWVVENPPRRDLPGVLGYWKEYADYGTLWHALNADSRLASVDFQEVTFPYCALGAAYQKVTTLRSNAGPVILAFRISSISIAFTPAKSLASGSSLSTSTFCSALSATSTGTSPTSATWPSTC
jgi:hypothetical protein